MQDDSSNKDIIDRLYAVAMEPERLHELIDIWQDKLDSVDCSKFIRPDDGHLLKRHMARAETVLSLVLENEDVLPTPLQEKLNSEPQAILALTMDGIIEALNPAAETLFGVTQGGNISDLPITNESKTHLKSALLHLSKTPIGNEQPNLGIFRLSREDGKPPLLISFTPWTTSGSRRFLFLKTADFVWPDYLTPLIEKAFQLTEAETDVVKLIVEGNKVEQIAKLRGTTISTVRFQIRSIYAKTSTKNQSEFIRLAIGLSTLQMVDKNVLTGAYQQTGHPAAQAYPLPEHRRLLSLPDGRILDYAIFGPKDGKPCVFFHNEYFGDVWTARIAAYAIKNKLFIIAPARPYYARSSPYPKGVNTYRQFTADLDILLNSLNVKSAVHICQTAGGLYSMEYALAFPDKVHAIVNIAPMLPMPLPEDEKKMTRLAKFSVHITRHPYTLKFLSKSGWIYHNRVGSRHFMETMITSTEPDFNIIRDVQNSDAITRGFQFGTTNGHLAFYHDLRCISKGNWHRLGEVQCPIYNIIGSEDRNSRAKRADRAMAEGLNLKKIIAKNGGEMLMFSHPELIINTVLKAWKT